MFSCPHYHIYVRWVAFLGLLERAAHRDFEVRNAVSYGALLVALENAEEEGFPLRLLECPEEEARAQERKQAALIKPPIVVVVAKRGVVATARACNMTAAMGGTGDGGNSSSSSSKKLKVSPQ
jgi:hypothetical protein